LPASEKMDGATWSPREKVPVVIAEHHSVSMGVSSEMVIRALNKAGAKRVTLFPSASARGCG
jgi:hypothetical protein